MASEAVIGILLLLFTTVSLFSGLVTVSLIRASKRWNGYLLLVFCMSLSQILFDLSYYVFSVLYTQPGNKGLAVLYVMANVVGGLCTSLWANVIAGITCYVVWAMRPFNIHGHFPLLLLATTLPALGFCAAQVYLILGSPADAASMSRSLSWAYYWTRLASIALNFLLCALCAAAAGGLGGVGGCCCSPRVCADLLCGCCRLGSSKEGQAWRDRVASLEARAQADPQAAAQASIRTVAQTMLLYPLVQTVTRVGAAWYESAYGFSAPAPDQLSSLGAAQAAAAVAYAVLTPSAGTGYFLVYLAMQPASRERLQGWLRNAARRALGLSAVTDGAEGEGLDEGLLAESEREPGGSSALVRGRAWRPPPVGGAGEGSGLPSSSTGSLASVLIQ